MPHVTIEHMIMLPLLILQIFLFPLTVSWLMDIWVNSRRTLELQDAASHLASVIQQAYAIMKHATIKSGTAVFSTGLPPYIENHSYIGTATLKSNGILKITLKLKDVGITKEASVILGANVTWRESTFISNSANAYVVAEKFPNNTICLFFGGD